MFDSIAGRSERGTRLQAKDATASPRANVVLPLLERRRPVPLRSRGKGLEGKAAAGDTAGAQGTSHRSHHAHPVAGVLSPRWGRGRGTPRCQAAESRRGAHGAGSGDSPGTNVSLFRPDLPGF